MKPTRTRMVGLIAALSLGLAVCALSLVSVQTSTASTRPSVTAQGRPNAGTRLWRKTVRKVKVLLGISPRHRRP